jgi:hypothetical protein
MFMSVLCGTKGLARMDNFDLTGMRHSVAEHFPVKYLMHCFLIFSHSFLVHVTRAPAESLTK